MRYTIIVFLILLSAPAMARLKLGSKDSLLTVATTSQDDLARYSAFRMLVRHYSNQEDSALWAAEQSLISAEALGTDTVVFAALMQNRAVHAKLDRYVEAYRFSYRCEELARRMEDSTRLGATYSQRGRMYFELGKLDEALHSNEQAIDFLQNTHDVDLMIHTLFVGGWYSFNGGRYQESIPFFEKSLSWAKKHGRKGKVELNHWWLGNAYSALLEHDKALKYNQLALNSVEPKDIVRYSDLWRYRGSMFRKMGELDSAIICFQRSFDHYENKYNWDRQGLVGAFLAESLLAAGKTKEALAEVDKLLNADERYTDDFLSKSEVLKVSSKVYQEVGQHDKAIQCLRDFMVVQDSLDRAEERSEVLKDQMAHELMRDHQQMEFEKERLELERQKNAAVAEEEIEKQRLINYGTMAGAGALLVFLVIVVRSLIRKRRDNRLIIEQKDMIEERSREIMDSIGYAKRIQNAILPSTKVVKQNLQDSFILYKPKDIVAGDFYWMEQVDDIVLFAAADCTGHGVPGAMVSVVCHNAMNRAVREFGLTDPARILDKTREIVIAEFAKSEEEVKDGMDIALCALQGNTLRYAGANNPLWILREENEDVGRGDVVPGGFTEVKADKQPIGRYAVPQPFTTHEVILKKGDCIYIFSDGFADQFGGDPERYPTGKKLKSANFKKLLLSIRTLPMQEQRDALDRAFEEWRGDHEQVDDVCVIGVRV